MSKSIVTETTSGKLAGTKLPSEIYSFKGVPYALPPTGSRRWKPAQPVDKWNGIRPADQFADQCIQPLIPSQSFYYLPPRSSSEDCLYLNIWTPQLSADGSSKPLAVMVWIHGGCLVYDAGSNSLFDGAELAQKGIVVVTINYRLNIFGYFSHPELSAESPYHVSGNYGTTDQIEALKWVQQNISAFGGDPNNVTVFGESAGALSVSHLLASPLAEGLFHRAIMQSPYLPPIPTLSQAEETGLRLAEEVQRVLSVDSGKGTGMSLAELRQWPAEALMNMAVNNGYYHSVETAQAVLDNWVFRNQISETFEQGKQHNVPVLVGFNSGELRAFADVPGLLAPQPSDERQYIAEVKARYGALADDYLALYPPDNLSEAVFAPVRDGFYGWASERFATMMSKIGSSAYLYYFGHETKWAKDAGLGAFHGAEIGYVFNNIKHNAKYSPNWPDANATEADLSMADTISDYWVAFAKLGEPKVEKKPVWKPYRKEDRNYMAFRDGLAQPGKNLLPGAFELHEKIVAGRREQGYLSWWLWDIGLSAPLPDEIKKYTMLKATKED